MCRVTVTAGTAGIYLVTDSTPSTVTGAIPGLVTLSADGTILTFPAVVTTAIIWWLPVPNAATTGAFANS